MSRSKVIILLLGLAGLASLQTGCVSSILATRAVKAPNLQRTPRAVADAEYARKFDSFTAQSWRLRVGPPPAELSIAVVEPGNYQFNYSIELKEAANGWKWPEPKYAVVLPRAPLPMKGTLLLLHGYMDAKENMMHWALCLAEAGWRCVLVDLRGHGRSTGDLIGFGAFEARDLAQVVDDLQQRGLAGERIGIVGVSYGASMGLLLAAQDKRVGAIVALEPFSNAAKALIEFAHGVAPQQAAEISPQDFATAVAKAARKGGFSWNSGDVLAAMEHVTIPVLFYHGAKDTWLSPDNSRDLYARAHPPSRLVILPDQEHVILSMRLGNIVPEVREWFDRYLAVALPSGGAGP